MYYSNWPLDDSESDLYHISIDNHGEMLISLSFAGAMYAR